LIANSSRFKRPREIGGRFLWIFCPTHNASTPSGKAASGYFLRIDCGANKVRRMPNRLTDLLSADCHFEHNTGADAVRIAKSHVMQ
jgi:hypothetical protein